MISCVDGKMEARSGRGDGCKKKFKTRFGHKTYACIVMMNAFNLNGGGSTYPFVVFFLLFVREGVLRNV